MITVAVIVTTYNQPDALRAVIEGYRAQTDGDFQLIVADDGSTHETAQVIEEARTEGLSIQHVWHEDQGFRAAAIRNRAVAADDAHYIVFTDGDCIPLPQFVARHRRLAEPGRFVSGNRILLGEKLTRRILTENLPLHTWTASQWLRARLEGEVNRWLPTLTLPLDMPSRKWNASSWKGVMTCNLGAWRKDLLEVDGLDESYSGWGLEDSDLAIRLLHAGIRKKSARFAAPVLHLHHRENDRGSLEANRIRLDETLRSGRTKALKGLSQYLKNPQ